MRPQLWKISHLLNLGGFLCLNLIHSSAKKTSSIYCCVLICLMMYQLTSVVVQRYQSRIGDDLWESRSKCSVFVESVAFNGCSQCNGRQNYIISLLILLVMVGVVCAGLIHYIGGLRKTIDDISIDLANTQELSDNVPGRHFELSDHIFERERELEGFSLHW